MFNSGVTTSSDTIRCPASVPRSEFDPHWEEHSSEGVPESKKREARQFLQPLLDYLGKHAAMRILDAGCGDGVHLQVFEDCSGGGARQIVGLDISFGGLLSARRRVRGAAETVLVQGDVGSLPFADKSFDAVFSFGVLAYSSHPPRSFAELHRILKPGGLLGVWLYPKRTGLGGLLFRLARSFCRVTGRYGTSVLANCLVPILGFLPTRSKASLANASWRQCREVVLVNIAPRHLAFSGAEDVEGWFARHGMPIVHVDPENPLTYWGVRP